MKTIISVIGFVALVLGTTHLAMAGAIRIDSVDVIPNQPLNTDLITFNISGQTGYIGSHVEYDQFLQDGTDLQLDLYFDIPMLPVVANWTYSKQIQPLGANNYTLEVRAFNYYNGLLQDTYITDFSVVPEPATFVFLAIGLPVVRAFLRRKS